MRIPRTLGVIAATAVLIPTAVVGTPALALASSLRRHVVRTTRGVSGTPTLRLGSTGPAVVALQGRLAANGQNVKPDGVFGPKTAAAVAAFQRSKRLKPDSIVGPMTWAALGGTTPTNISFPTTTPPTTVTPSPGPWKIYGALSYTTRAGDTWVSIAKAKGSTAVALAAANQRAATDRLSPGTTLSVPGAWRCPVPGGVFINDWHFPRPGGHLHEGTDLFAPRGTPIFAPVAGVAERSPNGLGGNAIQLQGADGNRYYFAHLNSYGIAGSVPVGALIGYVGNSGDARTTVTHLHFELHPGGGAAVNPFPTLTLACRR